MRQQRGFSLLLYGIVALAVLATLSGIAYRIYQAGADAVRLEWSEANRLQREAEAKQANEAATKLEVKREKAKVIYRTITQAVDRIVEKPVYRNVCLDADGLRIANCAISGKSADSCKPRPAVPASTPAHGRHRFHSLALDYGSGRILP